jgi:type IV secretion system protein VirB9
MIRRVLVLCAVLAASSVPAWAQHTREVVHTPTSVIPIATKVRFTTLILLPDGEEILDFVCGDRDYWVVSGAQHFAYVKPARAGASTNLNLITASGRVYSFLLTEGSTEPDLKVYVRDQTAESSPPRVRWHTPAEVEALREDVALARREAQSAREAAAKAVEDAAIVRADAQQTITAEVGKFRASYPGSLQFPYRLRQSPLPFGVTAIFHDDRFTYIRARARELPALYELVDGQPRLVSFQVEGGLYIVPRVLEHGYLSLGKQVLRFDAIR